MAWAVYILLLSVLCRWGHSGKEVTWPRPQPRSSEATWLVALGGWIPMNCCHLYDSLKAHSGAHNPWSLGSSQAFGYHWRSPRGQGKTDQCPCLPKTICEAQSSSHCVPIAQGALEWDSGDLPVLGSQVPCWLQVQGMQLV